MTEIDSEIDRLRSVAQNRWLKPNEVLFILENCDDRLITAESPKKPPSGSLFLFNRRVLRFFRNDGHLWRRKKDGRTVGEAHERLKVGNVDRLNCYYAHGEHNSCFQRRSYWILDPDLEHIVLVHYRDVGEPQGGYNAFERLLEPSASTNFNSAGNTKVRGLTYHSPSPISAEVVSGESSAVTAISEVDAHDHVSGGCGSSSMPQINQALRKLEMQLSLEDYDYDVSDVQERISPYIREEYSQAESHIDSPGGLGSSAGDDDSSGYMLPYTAGEDQKAILPPSDSDLNGRRPSIFWEEMLELTSASCPHRAPSQENTSEEVSSSGKTSMDHNIYPDMSNSCRVSEDLERNSQRHLSRARNILLGPDSPIKTSLAVNVTPGYHDFTPHESGQITSGVYSSVKREERDIDLADQRQFFSIREISPDWAYSSEPTKVVIVGDFFCNFLDCEWKVMFGDIEVPAEIIQKGVVKCMTPEHVPGKVNVCLTSGNQEFCSEVRVFTYHAKPTKKTFVGSKTEELNLLLKLVQILLNCRTDEIDDRFGKMADSLLSGSEDIFDTVSWLLEELLKDKLKIWISSKTGENQPADFSLTREEQNILHMISGLGYEWALGPLLNLGIGVNFRDSNGWTALHWAARFGRENMVAALLAAGASALAVTDPTALNPSGKTPASIAADFSHKGLAGYLSEVSLTSHLSSLTVEESSKKVFSERNTEIHPCATEEQLSFKDSLAAVRNATLAAACIQLAFRAHSFRKRHMNRQPVDHMQISHHHQHHHPLSSKAALCIQRKYRGWKWRRNYLSIRQNVVKIQAHVRGHQVRKKYKEFIWTVGVLEKVVLRWRRKGVGLRGFKIESDTVAEEINSNDDNDDSEDDDILKVFRKQKVDAAIDEAVKRVLSMVESTGARQQYRRMMERYRLAKLKSLADCSSAEAGVLDEEAMIFESLDDL